MSNLLKYAVECEKVIEKWESVRSFRNLSSQFEDELKKVEDARILARQAVVGEIERYKKSYPPDPAKKDEH